MLEKRVKTIVFTGRNLWWALLGLLAIWGVTLAIGGRGEDLGIYLRAAGYFWDGSDIYHAGEGREQLYLFKYSPASAWLFLPLAALPFKLAILIWNLGCIAALGYVAHVFSRPRESAPDPGGRNLDHFWPKLIATLALGYSIYCEMFYGQVNCLILFLLVWSYSSAEKDRPVLSGIALALAIALKPQALVFGLYFLMRRRYKPLLVALAATLALWLPVFFRYGAPETFEMVSRWREMLARTTPPWILGYNTQGLPTALVPLFMDSASRIPSVAAVAAAMLIATALYITPLIILRPPGRPLAALLCLGCAMLTPHAWLANFTMAWPLVYLCLTSSHRLVVRASWGLCSVLFLMGVFLQEGVLGKKPLRTVMHLRPYTIVVVLLVTATLIGIWLDRRRKKPIAA